MNFELPLEGGFVRIPSFSKYAVNPEGTVLNLESGIVLRGSKNPAGYVNFRLRGDDGATLTWGVHRLLALVFIPCEGDYRNMVVNHLDGRKSNNRLSNLEWTTYGGNIRHAGEMGLTSKCTPVSVREPETGYVREFESIADCASKLNMSKYAISWRLRQLPTRVFPEGLQYRRKDSKLKWEPIVPFEGMRESSLLVRELLTGSVTYYVSQRAAATDLKCSEATISKWSNLAGQPTLPGLIQIQKDMNNPVWRHVSDPYFEIEDFTKRRVVRVVRVQTQEVFIYTSAIECCEAHAVNPTALDYRLKCKGRVFDGLTFEYYRDFINNSGPL